MTDTVRVLVVGCGHMGTSHARAYDKLGVFEIVGLVSRGPESRGRLSEELGGLPTFGDYSEALAETSPDAVCISTYPDTHADYTIQALEAGAHVFVEKPLAETVEDAERVAEKAKEHDKKVVVGYILRHHPGWAKFTEVAQTLGKPLVTVGEQSVTGLIKIIIDARNGRHVEHEEVTLRRFRRLRIAASEPLSIHLDGQIGSTTPFGQRSLEIAVLPRELLVVA